MSELTCARAGCGEPVRTIWNSFAVCDGCLELIWEMPQELLAPDAALSWADHFCVAWDWLEKTRNGQRPRWQDAMALAFVDAAMESGIRPAIDEQTRHLMVEYLEHFWAPAR